MATPMLLMGTDKSNNTVPEETNKAEPTKLARGKKTAAARNPNQKKQPQRGLGVAQLERLRLQERWKKMNEIAPPHHFHSQSPFLLDPTFGNFPLQFPGAAHDCGGVLGFDQQGFVVQRIGNGGFPGCGGLMAGEPYPHGGVAVDPRLLIGNSVEASRELSSIPKLPPPPPPPPCVSDRCDICFKKKRVNFINNGSVKEKSIIAAAETPPPVASFDFLGLSTNPADELTSAAVNHYHPDSDFSFNFNQGGAEIKAIHRKVAGKGGGGGVGGDHNEGQSILLEYEFFPRTNGRGTEFEELEIPKEEEEEELGYSFAEEVAVVAVDHGGEGSCITTSCPDIINGGTSTSTALDLSLKLSF